MAGVEFYCNFKGCREPLFSSAWITKCSHMFCEEHGNRIPLNQKCPACNSNLLGNLDATLQNLNPSESFRSMILAGLRPEVIIDIIARAMAFRTYQVTQERAYYISTIQSMETQLTQQESAHNSELTKMQNDILVANKRQQILLTELEAQKLRVQEHESLLNEKNRQLQAMQMRFETLRCQATYQNLQSHNPSSCQNQNQGSLSKNDYGFPRTNSSSKNYMTQENFLTGQSQHANQPSPKSFLDFGFNPTFNKRNPRPSLRNLFQENEQ